MTLCLSFALLAAILLTPGCGGGGGVEKEEAELAEFTVREILVPREGERNFVAVWMRRSSGTGDISVEALAQRIWKWEGGVLSEIDLEEYRRLVGTHEGERNTWTYGEHSVTVMEYDPEKGEAVVEVGSLYGPMTGAGIRYFLRREGGRWKKVSEQTVWMSRAGMGRGCAA
ncbi:hypothetical protein [Candidatus Solincola tengchongensis]|uniref:hypothetical protein n=1 Tax=Candidatus Solincola tengchongensis TaxID=2900693 RepID=UPI00257B582D|nr:hypothetical protein [Candidatus Solincola tengchongensis]